MNHYVYKLIAPRPTFGLEMSEEEMAVMAAHAAHWAPHIEEGRVLVFGPVADPDGTWGLAVVAADDADDVAAIGRTDPAVTSGTCTFAVLPMIAATVPPATVPGRHPIAYFELTSPEPARAQAFYGDLFGWDLADDPSTPGYAMVDTGAGPAAVTGGIGPSMAPGDVGAKVYARVDDVDAHLERALALGATTILDPMDLPEGYGRIAVFADPDGTPFGLWT